MPDEVTNAANIVVASLSAQAAIQAVGAFLPLEWRLRIRWPFRVVMVGLFVPCLFFEATRGFKWPGLDWSSILVILFSVAPAIFTTPLSLVLIASKTRWAGAALFGLAVLTALTPWQLWSWIWAVN
ncbi:MAG: hypothetical protein ABIY37_15545 [Devosia sp.]